MECLICINTPRLFSTCMRAFTMCAGDRFYARTKEWKLMEDTPHTDTYIAYDTIIIHTHIYIRVRTVDVYNFSVRALSMNLTRKKKEELSSLALSSLRPLNENWKILQVRTEGRVAVMRCRNSKIDSLNESTTPNYFNTFVLARACMCNCVHVFFFTWCSLLLCKLLRFHFSTLACVPLNNTSMCIQFRTILFSAFPFTHP